MIPGARFPRNNPIQRLRLQLSIYPYVHKHWSDQHLGESRWVCVEAGPRKSTKSASCAARGMADSAVDRRLSMKAPRRSGTGHLSIACGPPYIRHHAEAQDAERKHEPKPRRPAQGGVLDGPVDQSAETGAGEECTKVLEGIDHAGRTPRHLASTEIHRGGEAQNRVGRITVKWRNSQQRRCRSPPLPTTYVPAARDAPCRTQR